MRHRLTAFFVLFLLLQPACSKINDGTITGRIVPPPAVAHVTALKNGKPVASLKVTTQDGIFSMTLPSGTYDISITVPNSAFPLTYPAIVVEPGKTAMLPTLELGQPSGHAVISGKISSDGSSARISLSDDGGERATTAADNEGRYRFTELPAGTYTVQASAEGYAHDAITVNLAPDQIATGNMRLLYISSIDGVDWSTGKIHVAGEGLRPDHAANDTIRRELAHRAALADAQRNLLRILDHIMVTPDENLKKFWGNKKYTEIIQGFIQGYTVISEQDTAVGGVRVVLEFPLTGPLGLTRSLAE